MCFLQVRKDFEILVKQQRRKSVEDVVHIFQKSKGKLICMHVTRLA